MSTNDNLLSVSNSGLDWMAVFSRLDSALAGDPRGPFLKQEAAEQVRGILDTIERASWEDHIDELVKPRLERLLTLLEGKETGK